MEGGLTIGDVNELPGETSAPAGSDLELLYRESGPQLWRAIYAFAGGRRDIADDAVAEAFARAIERVTTIREPLPWIYRTAFRIAATSSNANDVNHSRRPFRFRGWTPARSSTCCEPSDR